MKIVRFRAGDDIAYGLAEAAGVTVYEGSPFVAWEATETLVPWEEVTLLAPVIPSKVVCVGKNYADHATEMGGDVPVEPIIFLKPATAVVGPGARIVYPPISREVHHEAELAVVIGRLARNVRPEDAESHIFGYTAANDVTARDLQRRDGQWTRAKGFDTFCPLGPAIETELDPGELSFHDYKTALQELVQGEGKPLPVYRLVSESGPDHRKEFVFEVVFDDGLSATGSGGTKKEAQRQAAKTALAALLGRATRV